MGCQEIGAKVFKALGGVVVNGPFAGVKFPKTALERHISPQLLGTYECELSSTWEKIRQGTFAQILNIGAAYGFFSVGLARMFPQNVIYAFEPDPHLRHLINDFSRENCLSNVVIKPFCDRKWLMENCLENAFILCDCEGFEWDLFCDEKIPQLATANLIIEVHEGKRRGLTSELLENLKETHSLRLIPFTSRNPACFRFPESLTIREREIAINEFRQDGLVWLVAVPLKEGTLK